MAEEKVILAVGAHPDDMDFGASGTIAKFIQDGYKVYYVLCTDGSRGADDPSMTHEKLSTIRRDEQLVAAKKLGITDVFFLNHPDTELMCDLQLKEELVRIIRTVRPHTVITMDPTYFFSPDPVWGDANFINHTDHRAAALATMDAVFPLSRDRLTFPLHEQEGLKPHVVSELWFTNMLEPKYIVDISDTLEKKLEALVCHTSQFDDLELIRKRITERAEKYGKERGYRYGENFTRLILPGHRK